METINATHTGYLKDGIIYEDYNWALIGRSVERWNRFLKTANKAVAEDFIPNIDGIVKYVRTYKEFIEEEDVWIDCSKEDYDKLPDYKRVICAKPVPEKNSVPGCTRVNPVYKKTYPSEVVYYSDKNFTVRLKAMIDRTLSHLGIEVDTEKFAKLMDIIGNESETYLFERKQDISNTVVGDHIVKFNVPDIHGDVLIGDMQVWLDAMKKDQEPLKD